MLFSQPFFLWKEKRHANNLLKSASRNQTLLASKHGRKHQRTCRWWPAEMACEIKSSSNDNEERMDKWEPGSHRAWVQAQECDRPWRWCWTRSGWGQCSNLQQSDCQPRRSTVNVAMKTINNVFGVEALGKFYHKQGIKEILFPEQGGRSFLVEHLCWQRERTCRNDRGTDGANEIVGAERIWSLWAWCIPLWMSVSSADWK